MSKLNYDCYNSTKVFILDNEFFNEVLLNVYRHRSIKDEQRGDNSEKIELTYSFWTTHMIIL